MILETIDRLRNSRARLNLTPISTEKIMKAQWGALQFKKELTKGRIRPKNFFEDFPDYGVDWHKVSNRGRKR